MSELLRNARLARAGSGQLNRVLIVIGDNLEARYWNALLRDPISSGGPQLAVERGKKGNLLGALQAYSALREGSHDRPSAVDRIIMLFGSGRRLSPFTQSLRNVKAAFPLPDGDRGPSGITIAEAVVRSTQPWIDCLRKAGFSGVVIAWGDEVLVPSVRLDTQGDRLSRADVVRFGWRTDPDERLAAQKEWLVVDVETGSVVRDVSRQSIDSLHNVLQSTSADRTATYVNLGSFAASHDFLSLASHAFGERVADDPSSANWDPYFWQALQSPSRDFWDNLVRAEEDAGLTGAVTLLDNIPDFFDIVQRFRVAFERRVGRSMRISVLDFGQPYWIDAGNHIALSNTFSDIFSDTQAGAAVRALLGLPDSLATGGSFIMDSDLPRDCVVNNAVVIGSKLTDGSSVIDGAVVLGSNLGRLVASRRACVIWSRAQDLEVHGPNGMAFRLNGGKHVVLGDESATTLMLGQDFIKLTYRRTIGSIDDQAYERPILGNPLAFSEAASLIGSLDPAELDRAWQAHLLFNRPRPS